MTREPAQRLGRGLASLLGDVQSSGGGAAPGQLQIDQVSPGPFQPRADIVPEGLTDLVQSIRAHGILQPLLVRPHPNRSNHYQIIAGERRWRAAQQAGLASIPCLVRAMTDSDATAAALVENLQRVDLNPIEEADGFRRLINEFGLTQEELGQTIGKSRSHVANTLRLLGLPQEVSDLVRRGELTAGHARAALACADPAAAAHLMVARGLSVRDAEALSTPTRITSENVEARHQSNTIDLRAIEHQLSEALGMQVTLSFKGKGGTVKIVYQTLDQLDYIVARLDRS